MSIQAEMERDMLRAEFERDYERELFPYEKALRNVRRGTSTVNDAEILLRQIIEMSESQEALFMAIQKLDSYTMKVDAEYCFSDLKKQVDEAIKKECIS